MFLEVRCHKNNPGTSTTVYTNEAVHTLSMCPYLQSNLAKCNESSTFTFQIHYGSIVVETITKTSLIVALVYTLLHPNYSFFFFFDILLRYKLTGAPNVD